MIQFKTWSHIITASLIVTLLCILVLNIHFHINYTENIRSLIRIKATFITIALALPLCVFFFWQMKKNYLLSQELQRLLNRDRLTDVATRDYFFSKLENDNTQYGVSLMVDIDNFKSINDSYGHLIGDFVIKTVANILKDFTHDKDIICRFGGEEFIIFLNRSDKSNGISIADKMRRKIADTPITVNSLSINVTVSIGGTIKDKLTDINESIKEADESLYTAKQTGRNKTIFHKKTL